ncbi:MAG: Gldg family protein [Phycisphaerae bacterium]|jgi:hypothetical protein
MAVDATKQNQTPGASAGRRFRVGTNVVTASILVVAIVVVIQAIAYSTPQRWDMTSSGVNSLSDATENLLRNLEANIRLTSLYFETDREEQDQPRYRQAAGDLLDLYEATNRTKVSADWINPLKDHEKFGAFRARLRDKAVFKAQIAAYEARIERYRNELDAQMGSLIQSELEAIDGLGAGIGGGASDAAIGQIEQALHETSMMLERTREQIDSLHVPEDPQYSFAVDQLRSFYNNFSKTLANISKFGNDQVARNPALQPEQIKFLSGATERFQAMVDALEEEKTKLQELEPLKYDEIVRELEPTANAIVVETDDDVTVVDFGSVWPPLDPSAGGRAGFKNRAFKGEEKLTSAVLRATHKEQTAVIFVRYGGRPLFMGGFMPGQPPAPYARMKEQLEEANFVVQEWDVKTADTPPEIDPEPTRTIYVVMKPTPPQQNMMGQPSQDPPFTDSHRRKVLAAIGDNGRALFVAGWHAGQFGVLPAGYEYNDYLRDDWGIEVDTSALLIQTTSVSPGKYAVTRRDFFSMDKCEVTDHDIVSGALSRELVLPACAPLDLTDPPPDGVEHHRLVSLPELDGVWGVKSLQVYQEQLRQREYLTLADGDLVGPFDLAVAATKGDAKTVVISSADFAVDTVAFAQAMSIGPRGLTIRTRNPGNVSLLVNSLHWLNDNTEFMNIGKPIDAAVLKIGSPSTVRSVQALTIFVWPMLALVCGGVAWWVRRR